MASQLETPLTIDNIEEQLSGKPWKFNESTILRVVDSLKGNTGVGSSAILKEDNDIFVLLDDGSYGLSDRVKKVLLTTGDVRAELLYIMPYGYKNINEGLVDLIAPDAGYEENDTGFERAELFGPLQEFVDDHKINEASKGRIIAVLMGFEPNAGQNIEAAIFERDPTIGKYVSSKRLQAVINGGGNVMKEIGAIVNWRFGDDFEETDALVNKLDELFNPDHGKNKLTKVMSQFGRRRKNIIGA